ncbi:2TM domain-containing protein [Rhodoferax sp.]|uniref:2TM domain-containing protein n=1 Tax=Rhodoferax sp. TaxID=50421 RepID=UPI00374CE334
MTTEPTNDPLERLARRRAGAKLGWYIHALVFVLVNTGLAVLSLANGRHWVLGPLLGWGLGLLVHGLFVFVLPAGSGWRERLVQQERERLLKQRAQP